MSNVIENYTKEDVENIKSELNDKYLRLYAEFENYKKRTQKEKEDIKTAVKSNVISSILDVDNDLSIAYNKMSKNEGIELILSKVQSYLKSQNITTIQTDEYESDIHEVISIVETGSPGIVEVVSKGYKLNDKIIRYPKVILGK